jgi:plasmid stabilization system protein ParE
LREYPELGASRDQVARGLRALTYRDYVIYYMAGEELVIVRVLHGARDARAIFRD